MFLAVALRTDSLSVLTMKKSSPLLSVRGLVVEVDRAVVQVLSGLKMATQPAVEEVEKLLVVIGMPAHS